MFGILLCSGPPCSTCPESSTTSTSSEDSKGFIWDSYERMLFEAAEKESTVQESCEDSGSELTRCTSNCFSRPRFSCTLLSKDFIFDNCRRSPSAVVEKRSASHKFSDVSRSPCSNCVSSPCSTRTGSASTSMSSEASSSFIWDDYERSLFAAIEDETASSESCCRPPRVARRNTAAANETSKSSEAGFKSQRILVQKPCLSVQRPSSNEAIESGFRDAALELARRERVLQRERDQLIRERDQLAREVEQLSRSAELIPRAPEYWINKDMNATPSKVLWPEGSDELHIMLTRMALHSCCKGRDGNFEVRSVLSVRAWWVENPCLWRQYCNKATEMAARSTARGTQFPPLTPPIAERSVDCDLPARLQSRHLNKSLNEAFLWHGSSLAKIKHIVQDGFDERVSNLGGMLGGGLYFAEDSCKSGQYSERSICSSRSHFFVLSRVLLGEPHYSRVPMPNIRRAPDGCDSVVYTPDHDYGLGHHREFVIYDRFQAYPEFIVEARTA